MEKVLYTWDLVSVERLVFKKTFFLMCLQQFYKGLERMFNPGIL